MKCPPSPYHFLPPPPPSPSLPLFPRLPTHTTLPPLLRYLMHYIFSFPLLPTTTISLLLHFSSVLAHTLLHTPFSLSAHHTSHIFARLASHTCLCPVPLCTHTPPSACTRHHTHSLPASLLPAHAHTSTHMPFFYTGTELLKTCGINNST